MTKQEKAALLAVGEKQLAFLEIDMDKYLQKKDFDLAWRYQCQYAGAVYMLRALGFISREDTCARTNSIFDRFLAAKYPGISQKEVV